MQPRRSTNSPHHDGQLPTASPTVLPWYLAIEEEDERFRRSMHSANEISSVLRTVPAVQQPQVPAPAAQCHEPLHEPSPPPHEPRAGTAAAASTAEAGDGALPARTPAAASSDAVIDGAPPADLEAQRRALAAQWQALTDSRRRLDERASESALRHHEHLDAIAVEHAALRVATECGDPEAASRVVLEHDEQAARQRIVILRHEEAAQSLAALGGAAAPARSDDALPAAALGLVLEVDETRARSEIEELGNEFRELATSARHLAAATIAGSSRDRPLRALCAAESELRAALYLDALAQAVEPAMSTSSMRRANAGMMSKYRPCKHA